MLFSLLLQPFCCAAASPDATGGTNYEIPLSELKKVEKRKTRKPGRKGRKEKSKPDSADREAAGDASGSPSSSGQSASRPNDAGAAPTPQTPKIQPPAVSGHQPETFPPVAGPALGEEGARITHDPNSYVIVGKRTVIKAVISSLEALSSVRCQFRSAENDGYAFVPMTKAEGSRYTYTAILPQLVEGARSLRYRFVAVDTLGRVTRSGEFVVPVVQSPVMPGWQRDPSQEAIMIGLENPSKPPEGVKE